ncbi:MAG: endopeptidase La [Butyribacter sp.]|nr:endopeptidase La [bacterium]MDY3855356.1 endopeptidase La [Butyribacter sp.]
MLVIPVFDTLILSNVQINVQEDVFSQAEIDNIKSDENFIIVPIKEQKERGELCAEDFYEVGIIATAKSVTGQEGNALFSVDTKERVRIHNVEFYGDRVEAGYEILSDIQDLSEAEEKAVLAEFKQYAEELIKDVPGGALMKGYIRRWKNMNEAATNIGGYLDFDEQERAEIMCTDSLKERYGLIMEGIRRLMGNKSVQDELKSRMSKEQQDSYKVMAIKKQMQLLEEQLQEMEEDFSSEEEMFAKRIEEAQMPEEAEKEAKRVLKRFAMEGSSSHEYGMLYDYLDFVTTLSWKEQETEAIDLAKARKILDDDHFGLDKVKKRVLEQIAVMSLRGKQSGSILLFVGAPGTGKTSMGKSIANALGREYVRISLGGIRDEAEIRGHRRTYVGAMPGRIMEGIKRSKVNNPVVVLDEIDKLTKDYNGDPASALLEVLDPEQNNTFVDHYLNVPYDLSNVFFLCTANTTDGIPKPLLDRMEVISLSGYTPLEKYQIGRKYLLPKAIEDAGLKKGQCTITQGALKKMISDYTMEAGVRGLRKQLDKVCRYAAVKAVEEGVSKVSVKEKDLIEILGAKTANHDTCLKKSVPGVATGLAWTQVGGEILFIETVDMPGSGKVKITGQLGDVMKESAEIAYTLVQSVFADGTYDFKTKDIHIHVPEGAVPKDGPSAGITLFTALTSLVTQKPVQKKLAMTGEVSLRGEVLPIGGLPEKLMAAQRAGMQKVLIPKKNEEDLNEVSDEIKDKLTIIPVSTIQEVIKESIGITI